MTEEPVMLERRGALAILTLNRPAAGNAIDASLARALKGRVAECESDTDIRAVLLRASGRYFCVGGDVASFGQAGEAMPGLLLEITASLHDAVSRLARMSKPLVTEIQGFAAGGGFGLALLGDIVLAGASAQFTLAYTAIGLTPDGGASWLLPRLVGLRQAQRMLLLNPRLDARDALALGLITEVVDEDELADRALAIAGQLAAGPTQAIGRIRDLLLSSGTHDLEAQLGREAHTIALSGGTRDGQVGVTAFLAKQPPHFTGAV